MSTQIFSRIAVAGLTLSLGAGALVGLPGAITPASAFDGTQIAPDRFENSAPLLPAAPGAAQGRRVPPRILYHDVGDAIQQGVRDYKAGEKLKAADALEYAASEGSLAAQWKLGRMYADGDGVDHDDYKAFRYFSKLADLNADISPDSRQAPAVSKAFVALGLYYLNGIPSSPVKANPARAQELFHYAAAYFGDPDGQYYLGRIYLDGPPAERDSRRAAQWLNLSAEKGHVYAMALLGNLLIEGGTGVPRQVPKGLMWLQLAKLKADVKHDGWVLNLADLAFQRATDEQKALAQRFLSQQVAGTK